MAENIIAKCTEFSRDLDNKTNDINKGLLTRTENFIQEEVNETISAIKENDLAEIVDGFGDIAFLSLNGIYQTFIGHGCSHELSTRLVSEVMNRICNANLGKKQPDGSVKRNEHGKVVKPENWKAPTYDDIFQKYVDKVVA